jgi:hypothetical protein
MIRMVARPWIMRLVGDIQKLSEDLLKLRKQPSKKKTVMAV